MTVELVEKIDGNTLMVLATHRCGFKTYKFEFEYKKPYGKYISVSDSKGKPQDITKLKFSTEKIDKIANSWLGTNY